MKIRLDELLVIKGIAENRSKSRHMILDGLVTIEGNVFMKPGQTVVKESNIEIQEHEGYVGRGALKIKGAIEEFKISPKGLIVADVGASTGGFTDYLLKKATEKVYAIDVGHDQLAPKLLSDKRVINMEGTNIRDIKKLDDLVDLAVVDLSYISLRVVLGSIFNLVKKGGDIITLIKPQFEAGPKVVGKDGVIKDIEKVNEILEAFKSWAKENGFNMLKIIPSPITGKKGNKEFLAHFKK